MTASRSSSDGVQHYRSDSQNLSDDNTGFLIKQVFFSMNRMLDQEMAPLELTAMQWRPIALLCKGRADTPAELARLNGVDTGAMTRTLDRLEAKGLVRRNRSLEDRRVIRIELTESGKEKGRQIPHYIAKVLNHHLRGFSPEEVNQMRHLLRRMLANGSDDGL
ncbi:transcriptional regulator (MarR family) [Bordetella ansorpii]|uniref:Transcriptional regulator (MarR family) n=1 Tax=Bordetella ansorpii TaxID=288768 RepID=A0A157QCM8_9BORD|nr:MarR family transcriptional regulator [Bordetella ansorpii]SAI43330.1 transcriptional regulator (MarR family) [Bordetella ansorpii]